MPTIGKQTGQEVKRILQIKLKYAKVKQVKQFREICSEKMIAALSRYDDEIEELKQTGVQVVLNLYAEAGVGYAEQVYQIFNQQKPGDALITNNQKLI